MSILDKAIAAITPPEKDADRVNARELARSLATPGDWFSLVLDHHLAIEDAFKHCRAANTGPARTAAMRELAIVLNGHSTAEETVLYPAMTTHDQQGGATMAYQEQALAKVQMAMLERLDPTTQAWIDKLDHIQGAVSHHMYEEEGTWFARMKQASLHDEQDMLRDRFAEEFERYVGPDIAARFNGRHVGATGLGTAPLTDSGGALSPSVDHAAAH